MANSRYSTLCYMADNDEVREVPVQGNEWEVVSLTASAYAASPGPGPGQAKLIDDDQGHCVDENKKSDPEAMYMSHHFVFPPSQHENLPLVPKKIETPNEQTEQVHKDSPDFVADEGGISNTKDGEYWDVKALSMADEFPGMHFVDEKAKNLSESGTELEGGIALHSLTLADEEQTIYSTDKFSSVHGETTIGGYAPVEENRALAEPVDPSEGIYSAIIQSPEQMDQDKDDDSAAWWKRRASSLYAQAKEANAVWSIFIAAAVMGLVIIGQRWQQERWQVLQHNGPNGDEKASKMLGPLSRLKYVIIGGQQSGSVIRGSSSSSTQR